MRRERYRIIDELDYGGMGRILRARDTELDRVVAIKELLQNGSFARASFAEEIRITARLQHPSIISLHDAGRWPDGVPFFTMNLIKSDALDDAISLRDTRKSRLQLLKHVIDATDAIAYANSKGILHRDLKPANVLVGQFGETAVIDWGLAKDISDSDDHPCAATSACETCSDNTSVVGTPAYMPPEQAVGRNVDARADVYAIGAILYQVLSGVRPYAGVPAKEVLEAVGHGPPQPLEELAPDTPADLLDIVAKAMARHPDRRYPDAAQLAVELRSFVDGGLVAAHRYSLAEHLRRFATRRRAPLMTAVVAIALIIAVICWCLAAMAAEGDQLGTSAATQTAARRQAERIAPLGAFSRGEADEPLRRLLVVRAKALIERGSALAIPTL